MEEHKKEVEELADKNMLALTKSTDKSIQFLKDNKAKIEKEVKKMLIENDKKRKDIWEYGEKALQDIEEEYAQKMKLFGKRERENKTITTV